MLSTTSATIRRLATITPALVIAGVVLSASPAQAAVIRFSSALAPEVAGATGTGFVEVLYNDVAKTLAINATFSGLSGTTTVAHIHCCTTAAGTGTVGVAVTPGTLPGFPGPPNGVSAGTYNSPLLDLTASGTYTNAFRTNFGGGTDVGASAALLQGMYAGKAYFNVHSSTFPGGEIRGFLAVPEPATMALLGVALAGFAVRRRRQ